ncbi:MAG: hypothetical protein H6745_02335 [Deltaproteobacteria bacterium]|nr:hypothetical protein [Deltaproteobacteria bacterium]
MAHARCGTGARCEPGDPLTVSLSRPLDGERFDPAAVVVEPPVVDLAVRAVASSLIVSGRTRAETRYTVTLPASLADVTGEVLGAPVPVPWDVGAAPHRLVAAGGPVLVAPVGGSRGERGPTFAFTSRGHALVHVSARRVAVDDWDAFADAAGALARGEQDAALPGEVALDEDLAVAAPGVFTELSVDLAPALPEGRGHLVVVVEPRDPDVPWYERERLVRWVEVTALGVDALPDRDSLLAWVTEIRAARPSRARR